MGLPPLKELKFVPTLTLALALSLVLAACSSTPPDGQDSSPTAPPATALKPTSKPTTESRLPTATLPAAIDIDPAELRAAKVTFWHPWSGELGEAVQRAVNEFNARNEYGITVLASYQGNYNDLYAQVEAALQPGATASTGTTLPGVVVGYAYRIQAWQAATTLVVDLNAYVNDPQWGFSLAEQADFYPVFWSHELVEGTRLGIPALRYAQVMVYNTTWARELGFQAPPETPSQFKRQACAASTANDTDEDPDNDGSGGWVTNTAPAAMLNWMFSFGSQVTAEGGKGYRFNSAETTAALTFLKDLYDSGCAWQGAADQGFGEGAGAGGLEFAARQALMITSSVADLPEIRAAMEHASNPDEWTVIPFPTSEAEPVTTVFGPAYALFSANAEEELAAWIFLKWMVSADVQSELVTTASTYPLSDSLVEQLQDLPSSNRQWSAAMELLPSAQPEPNLVSWETVRWAVSDAGAQIFRYYFTPERIPATLELLDETAAELFERTADH